MSLKAENKILCVRVVRVKILYLLGPRQLNLQWERGRHKRIHGSTDLRTEENCGYPKSQETGQFPEF